MCEERFEGILPDNKPRTRPYEWAYGRGGEIDMDTAIKIYNHHLKTRSQTQTGKRINGHSEFKVELEDKSEGALEVSSYAIIYRERL